MTENTVLNAETTENEIETEETVTVESLADLNQNVADTVEEAVEQAQATLPEGSVVAAQIKTAEKNESIEKVIRRPKTIRFDLAIQRNDVWDIERRSKLIESYALGYPVPAVYSVMADKQDWMLDGKQRLTSILRFFGIVNDNGEVQPKENFGNGFRLKGVATCIVVTDDVGNVEGVYPFNGLTFNELDPVVQREILAAPVKFVRADSLTDAQKDEIFLRLNNGMPLVNMELIRAMAGSTVMAMIEEIGSKYFFTDSISLSDEYRNRFIDDELVAQVLMLAEDWTNLGSDAFFNATETLERGKSGKTVRKDNSKNRGFDAASITAAVITWKDHGYDADLLDRVSQAINYLGEAFPDNQKFLKKTHVPGIVVAAMEAMNDGVPAKKFGGFVQEFFARLKKASGTPYATASRAGAAKKNSVRIRVVELMKEYKVHIDSAPDYVAPITKQNRKAKENASQIAGTPVDQSAVLNDTGEGNDVAPTVTNESQSVDAGEVNKTDESSGDSNNA
jgi:hypothetical protein